MTSTLRTEEIYWQLKTPVKLANPENGPGAKSTVGPVKITSNDGIEGALTISDRFTVELKPFRGVIMTLANA
jgi:hypothetical protein